MEKRKKKKRTVVLLAVLVLLIALIAVVAVIMGKTANIRVGNVAVTEVTDGTYTGSCEAGLIYAEVSVTVKDGRMTDIVLIAHRNGKGAPAEAVVAEILAAQSLDVDSVAGATFSSKAIRKAVENALRKGIE